MASELRVNTLKDASGNNSIATSFVAGGSAKAWMNLNMSSGSANDSFNCSVNADLGTGRFTLSITSAMVNADYAVTASAADPTDASTSSNRTADGTPTSASVMYIRAAAYDNTANDVPAAAGVAHGDLA